MKRWFTKKRVLALGMALLLLIVLAGTAFALIPRPTTRWSYQPGPYAFTDFSPIISNGLVITVFSPGGVNDNIVSALDVHSGKVQWSTEIQGFISLVPVVADGCLYVVADDLDDRTSILHVLDAASGREQWSFHQALLSTPAIANGKVYIYSRNGSLYALSALSGSLLWSVHIGGDSFLSAPVVASNLVYIAVENEQETTSTVLALNATSGHISWSDEEATRFISQLAVANGLVYFAANSVDALVAALDAFSGKMRWSIQLAYFSVDSAPTFATSSFQVVNGIAYVVYQGLYFTNPSADSAALYALDAQIGQELWKAPTSSPEPTIANGTVYLYTDKGTLSALDARSGKQKWTHQAVFFDIGTGVEPEPALVDGTIYVRTDTSTDDKLSALDAISGSERWSYQITGFFLTPFVAAQGVVYGWVDKSFHYMVQAIQPPGGPPGFAM